MLCVGNCTRHWSQNDQYSSHPLEWLLSKIPDKQKITSVGKDVKKSEPLCTVGRNVKWFSTMENSMAVLQKIKSRITLWPRNPTCGYIPKELKAGSQRDIYTLMFLTALFTIATQVSADGWMDKQNVVYKYNGILFSLKKEGSSWHITWINLEDIMLSEIASHKKTTTVWYYLYEVSTVVKIIETESRIMAARNLGGRESGELFNGYRHSVLQDENILEIGYTTWIYFTDLYT